MHRISALAAVIMGLVGVLPASAGGPEGLPDAVTDADYAPVRPEEAGLGQALFYDPILSGNRNISCATCHHPRFATSDGLSLGLGEGGVGLGPDRRPDPDNLPEQRIPRNSPALFNLGAHEFTVLFHDGRIETDTARPSGLRTPLEDEMVGGFASVLSAQTMFPVLSPDEMAGHYQENDVAKAVRQGLITGPGGAWDIIAKRVSGIDAYQTMFEAVYPEIAAGRAIAFTDISDAIAVFIASEWRSDNSSFDRFLRDGTPLSEAAQSGLDLFYGAAGCAACHSGKFQTDHGFHAMGQPQVGPGKAERFESHSRDVGRMRVTGQERDAYAFRTPSLRNVMRTGPWGHAGAYTRMEDFLAQHADPAGFGGSYDRQVLLPALVATKSDWAALDDDEEWRAIMAAAHRGAQTDDRQIGALIAFLDALTDEGAIKGRLGVPDTVPSGLPVEH